MSTSAAIAAFVDEPALALIGASRSGHKFGNMAAKVLRAKGYRVHLIHPSADVIGDQRCYRSFADLPERVTAVVVSVPPKKAFDVVGDAAAAGILRVWLQQGSEAADIVTRCEEKGMEVVSGECILMHARPSGFHKLHRGLWRWLGKLPA